MIFHRCQTSSNFIRPRTVGGTLHIISCGTAHHSFILFSVPRTSFAIKSHSLSKYTKMKPGNRNDFPSTSYIATKFLTAQNRRSHTPYHLVKFGTPRGHSFLSVTDFPVIKSHP
uniref:Uncharacterized protein n=1 Tax=Caenorhabditis japonica TaxID=281687 RepID=A0A8R1IHL6_CAEJA